MYKINYPKNLDKFKKEYYNVLNKDNEPNINIHLDKLPFYNGSKLTFERLVGLDFSELITLEKELLKYQALAPKTKKKKKKKFTTINLFDKLFDYNKNQPSIASFFMNQDDLKLKVCHYCGIDYINPFKDIEDYKDRMDFVNYASARELQIVAGIAEKTANKIIKKREIALFTNIDQVSYVKAVREQITKFDFKNGHNHFTLDHVLPQKTHQFYSLCLFNFVPSCYSCNSKFKKSNSFIINEHLKKISPTSSSYRLTSDFKFKIYYHGNYKNIKKESDFVLYRKTLRNPAQLNSYFSIFKIGGRYTFQKEHALKLITQKVKYSNSKVKELSILLKLPTLEIKKMVFDRDLFDPNPQPQPLQKFKKDIAENLKIF